MSPTELDHSCASEVVREQTCHSRIHAGLLCLSTRMKTRSRETASTESHSPDLVRHETRENGSVSWFRECESGSPATSRSPRCGSPHVLRPARDLLQVTESLR